MSAATISADDATERTPASSPQGAPGVVPSPNAIAVAALRSDRFRLEREGDWQRLERIVVRLEKGRLRGISDEDLLALPGLYRTVASSLSIARETSLDAATLAYLEGLVQRAWFVVYGPRSSLVEWLRGFLGGGWSAAVRGIWIDVLIALAVMCAGVLVGWLLVSNDPDWYFALMSREMAGARVPGASAQALRETLFGNSGRDGLSVFAAQLFSNNAQVSILAFALGFAFGIPSLLLLIHNLALLGAMGWVYHQAGLGLDFAGWISVHGTTELYAILLSGAAGLHIGRSLAFPGDRPLLQAAGEAGRRAAVVMMGVVLMLIVAALLEGFARQLVDQTFGRLVIGGFMLTLWTTYFFAFRGNTGARRKKLA
ncbi:hypothetical protein WSK_2298 [Novosphingobium sp. Rr 2-17]|uniref:stage II sporulation protein M n=1 Tax=Novosphingobium sp. Rr 2-17 TaxID=555793 RepID=UPI0002699EBF|nr:stage II sporulation protein M [Novosphingobium sp. Rr 2-17]EIZ79111.1 hypothetical protein WSK_2298 [Novosphingobium sp. Rr 2-17]